MRWLSETETTQIAGFDIGGLVYVGDRLPAQRRAGNENCLIVPRLPVARSGSDPASATMPYWPSYSDIQPLARRTYLQWLASGRSDPAIEVGYVFLYFYGLERRLFLDRADHAEIIREVQRLRSVYGANGSFNTYSGKLLEAARLVGAATAVRPEIRPDLRSGYELPFDVRRYLGSRLAAREPLSADDALLWLLSLPDTYLRTPAVRCFREFQELWRTRFVARYPNGLRIQAPKTRLRPEYQAASGSFVASIDVGDMPDIAAVSAPLAPLRELGQSCSADLDSYSRLVGRRPQAARSAEAAALLPKELHDSEMAVALQNVRSTIEQYLVENGGGLVPVSVLCSAVGVQLAGEDKVSAESERQIASVLDTLGVGFEPDRRHGPSGLASLGKVALFRAPDGGPVEGDRDQYGAARTMLEVAALAAVSDGAVASEEVGAIHKDIEELHGLGPADVSRLKARLAVLLSDPPKQQAALTRLAKLDEQSRRSITQSAISAILADGKVAALEVKFLERLHKTLGLPVETVYATLHRASVASDEPVVIAAEQRVAGIPIPREAPAPVSGVRIDADRLARVRNETAAVSAMLADIFTDEQIAASPTKAGRTMSAQFSGLDVAHGELLAAILATAMDRDTFDRRAKDLRLMPDGAIETINAWAFDRFDEAAIDDEEQVRVVESLRMQIAASGDAR